jgi:hypothetical protein
MIQETGKRAISLKFARREIKICPEAKPPTSGFY